MIDKIEINKLITILSLFSSGLTNSASTALVGQTSAKVPEQHLLLVVPPLKGGRAVARLLRRRRVVAVVGEELALDAAQVGRHLAQVGLTPGRTRRRPVVHKN